MANESSDSPVVVDELNPRQFPVFCGDLTFGCDENDLFTLFAEFGKINSIEIKRGINNESRMHGFVYMSSKEDAETAIAALNGKKFMGRIMRVHWGSGTSVMRSVPPDKESWVQVHVTFASSQSKVLVTEEMLDNMFGQYGEIADTTIKRHDRNCKPAGQSGYGFVYFLQDECAINAVKALQHVVVDAITFDSSFSYRTEQTLRIKYPAEILPLNHVVPNKRYIPPLEMPMSGPDSPRNFAGGPELISPDSPHHFHYPGSMPGSGSNSPHMSYSKMQFPRPKFVRQFTPIGIPTHVLSSHSMSPHHGMSPQHSSSPQLMSMSGSPHAQSFMPGPPMHVQGGGMLFIPPHVQVRGVAQHLMNHAMNQSPGGGSPGIQQMMGPPPPSQQQQQGVPMPMPLPLPMQMYGPPTIHQPQQGPPPNFQVAPNVPYAVPPLPQYLMFEQQYERDIVLPPQSPHGHLPSPMQISPLHLQQMQQQQQQQQAGFHHQQQQGRQQQFFGGPMHQSNGNKGAMYQQQPMPQQHQMQQQQQQPPSY